MTTFVPFCALQCNPLPQSNDSRIVPITHTDSKGNELFQLFLTKQTVTMDDQIINFALFCMMQFDDVELVMQSYFGHPCVISIMTSGNRLIFSSPVFVPQSQTGLLRKYTQKIASETIGTTVPIETRVKASVLIQRVASS